MASENETVEIKYPGIADVLNELREYDSKPPPKFAWLRIADMLESAWEREIDVYKVGIRHLKRANKKLTDENKKLVEKSLSDESAWRREKAELERKVREHHLAFLAEKARHTDTYKDERIRAQDAEIKTLKSVLKIAEDTLTKISKDDLCGHREQAARALCDIRAEGGES